MTKTRTERLLLVDTTQYAPVSPWFDDAAAALNQMRQVSWRVLDTRAISPMGIHERFPCIRRQLLRNALVKVAREWRPTRIIIMKGDDVGPSTVDSARAASDGALMICVATDDPFNADVSSITLRDAIPNYDMYVTTKRLTVSDLQAAGARNVSVMDFAYKPAIHFQDPGVASGDFRSDVVFIGTYDKDRADALARVAALTSATLRIWGTGWQRDHRLRDLAGPAVFGREFRLAVKGAKVVLNFVRHSNRDDHSMRTFEVPACGGCMLSERTAPHDQWFSGLPSSLFDGTADLIAKLQQLLGSSALRAEVAEAQLSWLVRGCHSYADRLDQILRDAAAVSPSPAAQGLPVPPVRNLGDRR